MNAIEEYGKRKEQKGRIEGRNGIILQLYNNGMKPEEIATKTGINLKTIQKIINTRE